MANPTDQRPSFKDATGFYQRIKAIPDDPVNALREYVQDFAEKNKLESKQEFTDQEIRFAIAKAIDELNTIPPISINVFDISTNGGQVPASFLLDWGSINLIEMSLFRKLRNDLQYTDSGVTVDTEKFQKYMELLSQQRTYYFNIAKNYKQSLDINGYSGYLPSSMSLFSFYFW